MRSGSKALPEVVPREEANCHAVHMGTGIAAACAALLQACGDDESDEDGQPPSAAAVEACRELQRVAASVQANSDEQVSLLRTLVSDCE